MVIKVMTPVEKNRRRGWLWPTAAKLLKTESAAFLSPSKAAPQFGDLALFQVMSVGEVSVLETASGDYPICNSSVFVGVFSNRYALDVYEGVVPPRFRRTLHLMNAGGTVGLVTSQNAFVHNPTEVRCIGYLADVGMQTLNSLLLAPKLNGCAKRDSKAKLILALGAGMNYGKTTGAAGVVYCLNATGRSVVAGKATGTARSKDIRLMESRGARRVADFTAWGYPATYMVGESELKAIFWSLYAKLTRELDPDYIVIELADGIRQPETNKLINDLEIQRAAHKVLFACGDTDAAISGVSYLNSLGYNDIVLSGTVSNSELGKKEVEHWLPGVPIFDSLRIPDPRIGGRLFG
jgi:hypothetical protein